MGTNMQFSMMKLSSMMQVSPSTIMDSGDSPVKHVFDSFSLNQSIINHIQQLIHLLADIQRHRACSLAILSGNDSFDKQVMSLHRKINGRLHFLNSQDELTEVADPHEWNNILGEWKVVGYGWRRDNVLHNFELHSHLLEKILNMIRHTGRWILRSGSYSEQMADHYLGHEVFEFIFTTHLYQIETFGKLRGLGTHIANSGFRDVENSIDHAMRMRIEFLLQCAKQEQTVSSEFMHAHAASISRNIPALLDMQRSEPTLQEWLMLIADILQERITPSDALARQVFDLASTVIDARLALTEQILAYLHLAIEEMLETLLEETVELTT